MRCKSRSQRQTQKPRRVRGSGSSLMSRWTETEIGEITIATVIMNLTTLTTVIELVIGTIEILTGAMRMMDGEIGIGITIATMIDQDTVVGIGEMQDTVPATTMIMIEVMIGDITGMMTIIMEAMDTIDGEMIMMTTISAEDGAMIATMIRIVQMSNFKISPYILIMNTGKYLHMMNSL